MLRGHLSWRIWSPGTIGLQQFDGLATGLLPDTLGFPPTEVTASFTSLSTEGSSIFSGVTALHQFAVSGSQSLLTITEENSQSFSLTFSSPQIAFGFYATDPSDYFGSVAPSGTPPLRLLLEGPGGSTLLDLLPGVDVRTVRDGSVIFFGVIDTSNPFTRITLINPVTGLGAIGTDGIGVDDIAIGLINTAPTIVGCPNPQQPRLRRTLPKNSNALAPAEPLRLETCLPWHRRTSRGPNFSHRARILTNSGANFFAPPSRKDPVLLRKTRAGYDQHVGFGCWIAWQRTQRRRNARLAEMIEGTDPCDVERSEE